MFENWLKNHPMTVAELSAPIFPPAKDRAFWDAHKDEVLVKNAGDYLGYDWPQSYATDFMAFRKEGDRLRQETPSFARRTALSALVVGEIIEHEGRFLPDIVNGIFAICEETYWGISAHYPYEGMIDLLPDAENCYIDLFAAETAALLALTWQLLYDELRDFCPEILRRLEYEMERRIVKPYLAHRDFWWMGYTKKVNNWNPWILCNLLQVFLIMEKRESVFAAGLEKIFHEIDAYYLEHPMDGGCDEGASYWTAAGGMLSEFGDLMYRASEGKVNFFRDEKMQNVAKYIYRTYIGNKYFVNFADGPCCMDTSMAGFLYVIGLRTGDASLMAFSRIFADPDGEHPRDFFKERNLRRALYAVVYRKDILEQKEFVPVESCVLESVQNSFDRRGQWFCAAKGGHNDESHNHNDVGSFIAYYENAPVFVDPGCGVYTKKTFSPQRYEIWTMQSSWHNLPEVNGCAQLYGAQYRADGFRTENGSTWISFAPAYGNNAGLLRAERRLALTEDGPVWEDSFLFSGEENRISEHFVTPLEVTVEDGKAVLGGKFVIEADVPMTVKTEFISFAGDAKLTKNWAAEGMNRVCFELSAGTSAKMRFALRRK